MLFEKSARPPSYESPLKIPQNLAQLLAISILIANIAHSSVSSLLFTTCALGYGTIGTNL